MPKINVEDFSGLSDAEFEVMKIIWSQKEPVTSTFIRENLGDYIWPLSKIMSILFRLCEKNFTACDRSTRRNLYTANLTYEDFLEKENRQFLSRFYGDSVSAMLLAQFTRGAISTEESKKLKEIINSRKI